MSVRVRSIVVGAIVAAFAVTMAHADDLPAVSNWNGKLEGLRADLNGEGLWATTGSVTAPLGHSFGVQVDALGADYSATPTWGGGLHLFWRDPSLGLVGAVGSRTDFDGMAVNRYGLEGEWYAGPVTVAATGGWQNGDSLHTGWGAIDLRLYPIDNLVLEAGAGAASSVRTGHLGFEWQPVDSVPVTMFADGAIGTEDYDHALAGIRIYFGANKSLKARHREDDPVNLMVQGVSSAASAAAGKGGGIGVVSGGSVAGGGGGPGGGGGGGCFVAGIAVLMVDGTSKAIEDVKVGDRLLGADGAVNEVLELKRPTLGDRKLHSINGSAGFVTDSHPFMTAEGWKSIDPAATAKENPDLKVGRLAVGDLLVARGGTVKVASIEPQAADAGTQLYNFSVAGNRTYFVRDPKTGDFLLVHNK